MNFTFGIISGGGHDDRIHQMIDHIEGEQIPHYEVIVVGEFDPRDRRHTRRVPFDETLKHAWITRKKNIITHEAQYENIVYMHDYVALESGWYQGFLDYGEDFNVVMTRVLALDGSRFRDWLLNPYSCAGKYLFVLNGGLASIETQRQLDAPGWLPTECLLPYEVQSDYVNQFMYFSGTYWVAKKSVMERYPLDEALCWDEAEDVVWSQSIREAYRFELNLNSSVRVMQKKLVAFTPLREETIALLEARGSSPLTAESQQNYWALIYRTIASACIQKGDLKRARRYLRQAQTFQISDALRANLNALLERVTLLLD